MLFVETFNTFLKGYDTGFLKITRFSLNFPFGKNFYGKLVLTGGAAGV
jgi:hypothetical protein